MSADMELLQSALQEIRALRHDNEIMRAKVDTMNILACALGMRPSGGAMHPDIAWQIEKRLAEIAAEKPAP